MLNLLSVQCGHGAVFILECLSHHFQHTHTHSWCLNSGVKLAFCTVCALSSVFILEVSALQVFHFVSQLWC